MYVKIFLLSVCYWNCTVVAFKVYDMDRDGYISNGELFLVLKMMVGNNLKVCSHDVLRDLVIYWAHSTSRINNCNKLSTKQSWKRTRMAMEGSASRNLLRWFPTPYVVLVSLIRYCLCLIIHCWHNLLGHREANDLGGSFLDCMSAVDVLFAFWATYRYVYLYCILLLPSIAIIPLPVVMPGSCLL